MRLTQDKMTVIKVLLLLTFVFVLSHAGGCAKKAKHPLHLCIILKEKGVKPGGAPLSITISIDNKEVEKNIPLTAKAPIKKDYQLETGLHTIKITENSTSTTTQGALTADKEYWYRAVFNRETASIGYFDARSQVSPFTDTGITPAKDTGGKPTTGEKGSTMSDDFDKKLKALKDQAAKKKVKTWGKIDKKKKKQ